MHTDYADLTPREQHSDLEQADKVLKVLYATARGREFIGAVTKSGENDNARS